MRLVGASSTPAVLARGRFTAAWLAKAWTARLWLWMAAFVAAIWSCRCATYWLSRLMPSTSKSSSSSSAYLSLLLTEYDRNRLDDLLKSAMLGM